MGGHIPFIYSKVSIYYEKEIICAHTIDLITRVCTHLWKRTKYITKVIIESINTYLILQGQSIIERFVIVNCLIERISTRETLGWHTKPVHL